MERKVICALDTSDLNEALNAAKRLRGHVGGVKIGHALTLHGGLDVVKSFQDVGIDRVFLDLKFHDIPNSVALAVREAIKCNVWMMTLHISGGPAMITAAVEQAREADEDERPLLLGVSVLTSLDNHVLNDHLGVPRTVKDHMVQLSRLGVDCGLDGVVCSPEEVTALRAELGHHGLIIVPGIRLESGASDDQKRVGTATQAIADGADYLVIGRALMNCADPLEALESLSKPTAGSKN